MISISTVIIECECHANLVMTDPQNKLYLFVTYITFFFYFDILITVKYFFFYVEIYYSNCEEFNTKMYL